MSPDGPLLDLKRIESALDNLSPDRRWVARGLLECLRVWVRIFCPLRIGSQGAWHSWYTGHGFIFEFVYGMVDGRETLKIWKMGHCSPLTPEKMYRGESVFLMEDGHRFYLIPDEPAAKLLDNDPGDRIDVPSAELQELRWSFHWGAATYYSLELERWLMARDALLRRPAGLADAPSSRPDNAVACGARSQPGEDIARDPIQAPARTACNHDFIQLDGGFRVSSLLWILSGIEASSIRGIEARCIDGAHRGDTIQGGGDVLYGGNGDDQLFGGPGNDLFHGGGLLHGNDGDDRIDGANNDDRLYGDCGADEMNGRTRYHLILVDDADDGSREATGLVRNLVIGVVGMGGAGGEVMTVLVATLIDGRRSSALLNKQFGHSQDQIHLPLSVIKIDAAANWGEEVDRDCGILLVTGGQGIASRHFESAESINELVDLVIADCRDDIHIGRALRDLTSDRLRGFANHQHRRGAIAPPFSGTGDTRIPPWLTVAACSGAGSSTAVPGPFD